MSIIVHGRNEEQWNEQSYCCNAKFIFSDIYKMIPTDLISGKIDYIFLCAAITKYKDMILFPVDVITISVNGMSNNWN